MTLSDYLEDCDTRYSDQRRMLGLVWNGPGYHTRIPNGTWAHPTRESLDYALGLLISGEPWRIERAAAIVRAVLALQDTHPYNPTYGIWPWLQEEPLPEMAPPDWNWADFCGARLAQMLIEHAPVLPAELVTAIRTSLGHAAWSIFRRNVQPGYTNIAIMGAAVTLAAGEVLQEARLVEYGRARLRAFVAYTGLHGGFNEYNSPTYTIVALHECERILQLVHDPAARDDAEQLRRIAWGMIAESFHPATQQWAGPHSRTYADWIDAATAAYLSEQTGVIITPHPNAPSHKIGVTHIRHLPCPPELVSRFRVLPEDSQTLHRRFILRGSDTDSTNGTTWLSQDACLGSVNHDNLWTQRRPLIAYWQSAGSVAALRLRFLHDGQDFASAYVRNAQHTNRVLSVINMLTDMGDFHHHLDRPADGVFYAENFKVRYELAGQHATGQALGDGLFELCDGAYRAVIQVLPGQFGPYTVVWRIVEEPGMAALEGICYDGIRASFQIEQLGRVVLAAGLELLPVGEAAAPTSIQLEPDRDERLNITWLVQPQLSASAPPLAEPYPERQIHAPARR